MYREFTVHDSKIPMPLRNVQFDVIDKTETKPFRLIAAGGIGKTIVDPEQPYNDVDMFVLFNHKSSNNDWFVSYDESYFEAYKDVVKYHVGTVLGWKQTFECPQRKLFTFVEPETGTKVQLIAEQAYRSPEAMLNSFDFTTCHFAMTNFFGVHWKMLTHETAIRDVLKRKLRITNLTYPLATMNRMYKMRSRGYDIKEAAEYFLREVATRGHLSLDAMRWYID